MTIAYVGENTLVKQSGASSPASITYPSVTSTNLLVLLVVTGNNVNGTVTTPSGWTLVGTSTGGGGTWNPGDGPRRLTVFTKESDGTETGSFNLTWDSSGGAAMFIGQIHQFSKTTGAWDAALAAGDDTTAGSGAGTMVAVTSALDMAAGDMIVALAGGNSDGLISAASIAASGITFGTFTEQQADNQGGGYRAVYNVATAEVSSGTATTAVTLTYDALGDPTSGPAMAVRLRESGGGGGVAHTTTGALAAQSAVVAGSAVRTRPHPTTGALTAGSAVVSGNATRSAGPVSHPTTGSLAAQAATVAGAALRTRLHPTTGALTAAAATVAGTALRTRPHPATGALAAQAAVIAGSATNTPAAGPHASTGVLVASSATVAGSAVVVPLTPLVVGQSGSSTQQRLRKRRILEDEEVVEPVKAAPPTVTAPSPTPTVAEVAVTPPAEPQLPAVMRAIAQAIPPAPIKAQPKRAKPIAPPPDDDDDDQEAIEAAVALLLH